MEKGMMEEEPLGKSKSTGPEQIGVEVMEGELADGQLLHLEICKVTVELVQAVQLTELVVDTFFDSERDQTSKYPLMLWRTNK
jgi:hypothetical protein